MIIHISRNRFDRIQALSFGFPVLHPRVLTQPIRTGDNEYHLLEGERGLCDPCHAEFDSVNAESPVDLEYIKESMREPNPVKAKAILDLMLQERKDRETAKVMLANL